MHRWHCCCLSSLQANGQKSTCVRNLLHSIINATCTGAQFQSFKVTLESAGPSTAVAVAKDTQTCVDNMVSQKEQAHSAALIL